MHEPAKQGEEDHATPYKTALGIILMSPAMYVRYGMDPTSALIPISNPGIISIPLSFAAVVIVSLVTQKKPGAAQEPAPHRRRPAEPPLLQRRQKGLAAMRPLFSYCRFRGLAVLLESNCARDGGARAEVRRRRTWCSFPDGGGSDRLELRNIFERGFVRRDAWTLRVFVMACVFLAGIVGTGLVGPNRGAIEAEFGLSHSLFVFGFMFSATWPCFYAQVAPRLKGHEEMLAYGSILFSVLGISLCITASSIIADYHLGLSLVFAPVVLWIFGLIYFTTSLSQETYTVADLP